MRYFTRLLLFLLPLMGASCSYTFYRSPGNNPVSRSMEKITDLPDTLRETSGLVSNDGHFITFNDSGGDPALYTFTMQEPEPLKIMVQGAENADWEDIAIDRNTVYVADVGNNFGNRDTLVIYMIDREELDSSGPANVQCIITFSWDEPVSRTLTGFFSHDCEALFAYGDSLYLFSKDWVKRETRVYTLPKIPGHYPLRSRTTYRVDALITGADVHARDQEVVLVGYAEGVPLLIRYGFDDDPAVITRGGKARRYPGFAGTQMEGVCYDRSGNIIISSEKTVIGPALYRAY